MSHRSKQQELATFGYVRKHCRLNIPFVLIKLMKLYFDEYFYWSFGKGDAMTKFLNAKNGDIIRGLSSFKINDIVFECAMCPNGWRSNAVGCAQFYVELKHLPNYINNVTIYVELISETVPATRYLIRNWSKINGISWNKHTLKLEQFKHVTNAHFNCKVVLKAIEFKSNDNKKKHIEMIKNRYYIKPIKIKRISKFEWNISTDLLSKPREYGEIQAIYSPVFDDNWCIKSCRNFENDKSISFYFGCFAYPNGLHKMNVKIKAQSNCENFKYKDTEESVEFNDRVSPWFGWDNCGIAVSDLKEKRFITLNVEMEIMKLYDNENNNIETKDFHKYDIIE